MKSRPEKGKATTVAPVAASSVKNQDVNQGFNMSNSTEVATNSQPVFNFGNNQVRVVVLESSPWFVAADVWAALKLTNPSKAMKVLEPHERSNFKLGRQGDVNIVSESGLYTLILRCRDAIKPGTAAHKFKTWVTSEVLPSIRKSGCYEQAATAPRNPAIDYDRISPAQAQDLKEIVDAIVKAGMQGFGETWKRFQNKFKVNSYLELPATRHLEAREYLIAKLPKSNAETVVEEQPAAPSLFGRQWLVSTDMAGKETVRPVAPDQFVKSYREIARGIAVGDLMPSTAELVDLASACNQRLVHRLGNPALVLAV